MLRAGAWIISLVGLGSVLLPTGAVAQKQSELQILNRTVFDLQVEVGDFKKSTDEKISKLTALLEQTLDAANKANSSLAALKKDIDEKLADQQKTVAGPLAGMGSKIDTLTNEFSFVRNNVEIMNQRLTKLQGQVADLDNTIKTIQAPAAPPPAANLTTPSGVNAQMLMANAHRDKNAANFPLALSQFTEYVKLFPNAPEACEAQYMIGEIQFNQAKYKEAVSAFDLALERYPSTCQQSAKAREELKALQARPPATRSQKGTKQR